MADKKIRVLDLVQPLLAGGRMRSSLGMGCRPKGVQLRRSATLYGFREITDPGPQVAFLRAAEPAAAQQRRLPDLAGAAASGIASPEPASADALSVGSWLKVPGSPFVGYGQPSRFEDKVLWTRIGRANREGQFDVVCQSKEPVHADPFLIGYGRATAKAGNV
jgi:hypothetical protein